MCVRHSTTTTATLDSINAALIGAPVVPVCSVISFHSRDVRERFRISDFLANLTRTKSPYTLNLSLFRSFFSPFPLSLFLRVNRWRCVSTEECMKPSRKKVAPPAAKHFSLLVHRCTVARAVNGAQILGKDACPSLMEYR